MVNKKGQEMTLGTIIAMVLGIAVLVFLIWGFSTGWNNMWDRVTAFGGDSNVDTVVQSCSLKCSTKNTYGFCEEIKTVKTGSGDPIKQTCKALAANATNNKFGVAECDIC